MQVNIFKHATSFAKLVVKLLQKQLVFKGLIIHLELLQRGAYFFPRWLVSNHLFKFAAIIHLEAVLRKISTSITIFHRFLNLSHDLYFVNVTNRKGIVLVKLFEVLLQVIQVLMTAINEVETNPVINLLHINFGVIENQTVVAPLFLLVRLGVNRQQVVWHLILLMTHHLVHLKLLTVAKVLLELLLEEAHVDLREAFRHYCHMLDRFVIQLVNQTLLLFAYVLKQVFVLHFLFVICLIFILKFDRVKNIEVILDNFLKELKIWMLIQSIKLVLSAFPLNDLLF